MAKAPPHHLKFNRMVVLVPADESAQDKVKGAHQVRVAFRTAKRKQTGGEDTFAARKSEAVAS